MRFTGCLLHLGLRQAVHCARLLLTCLQGCHFTGQAKAWNKGTGNITGKAREGRASGLLRGVTIGSRSHRKPSLQSHMTPLGCMWLMLGTKDQTFLQE